MCARAIRMELVVWPLDSLVAQNCESHTCALSHTSLRPVNEHHKIFFVMDSNVKEVLMQKLLVLLKGFDGTRQTEKDVKNSFRIWMAIASALYLHCVSLLKVISFSINPTPIAYVAPEIGKRTNKTKNMSSTVHART